jgi:hypothetical protein
VLPLLRAAGRRYRKKLEEAARLWARGDIQPEQEHAKDQAGLDEQFAFFGLEPEGPVLEEREPFYLWPENLAAWTLFMAVQTQWRSGMGGRDGLDYAGVHIVIDQHRAWRTRRRRIFAGVQIMERACLQAWAEQSRAAQEQHK